MGLFSRAPIVEHQISFLGIEGQAATERCIMTAAVRGVDMQICYTSDELEIDHISNYQYLSPFERAPSLKDGNFAIAGLRGIITYLDTRGVGGSLQPRKARLLGLQNYWIELGERLLAPVLQSTENATRRQNLDDSPMAAQFIRRLSEVVDHSEFIVGPASLADPQIAAYIKLLRGKDLLSQEYGPIKSWYDRVFGLIPDELRVKYGAYFTMEKARKVA